MRKLLGALFFVGSVFAQTITPPSGGGGGGGTGCVPSGSADLVVTSDGAGGCQVTTLPLVGSTLGGNLLFTDNTYAIGAAGATRPKNIFLSTSAVIGTDNSGAGTLQLANGSANAHTIFSSGATTTNTIAGFATVPTTGHIVDCTSASTTCTLHDSGVVTANVVNASSPGAGVAHFAGSTQTVTSSAVVNADITSLDASTKLTGATPVANGGTGTASTLTGLVRGSASAMTAAEISGDCTTSGSNAITCTKLNGTSFAGTSGHIVSFGAANIPADSGLVAANQVNASSPGAGVAHFAGSTQTVTSSAVVNADITSLDAATKLTGIAPSANGGTGNGFTKFSGPGTSEKTFTLPNSSSTLTITVASGAKALATSAISSAACTSAQTDTATGTLTTDTIMADFNGDPTGVTGFVPLTAGMLTIIKYPTADTVNFKVCNNTSSSITPGAITLNWRVVR